MRKKVNIKEIHKYLGDMIQFYNAVGNMLSVDTKDGLIICENIKTKLDYYESKIDDMLLIADHRFNLLQKGKEIVKSQQSKIEELERQYLEMAMAIVNKCIETNRDDWSYCIYCREEERKSEDIEHKHDCIVNKATKYIEEHI